MSETVILPRRLMLTGALVSGVMLALAVHMLLRGIGLDMAGLFRSDITNIPITAGLAWWLVAAAGLIGGRTTAVLMQGAASGSIPPRLRQLILAIGVLLLGAAGVAASTPAPTTTSAGVLGGIAALAIGGLMALCGAYPIVRKDPSLRAPVPDAAAGSSRAS